MRSEYEIRKRKEYWDRLLRNKGQLCEVGDISRSEFLEFQKLLKSLSIELEWVLQEDNQ
jgi:hypothetical protein